MITRFFLIAIGFLSIFLGGCGIYIPFDYLAYVDYKETGHSWVGKPVSQVVKRWGKPQEVVELEDGSKDYRWYWSDTYTDEEAEGEAKPKSKKEASESPLLFRCASIMRVNVKGKVVKFIPDNFDNNCDQMPPLAPLPGYKLHNTTSK